MIYLDEKLAEAQVYGHYLSKNDTLIYLVKVSFTDIGFYINSITVQPSPKYPERGLWVQLPRYNAKGKWIRPMELSRSSPLQELIESVARTAVEEYKVDSDNYIPSDDEMNSPINLDDIPFFNNDQPP